MNYELARDILLKKFDKLRGNYLYQNVDKIVYEQALYDGAQALEKQIPKVVTNNIMEIARVKKEAKSEVIKEFAKRVKTKAKMYNAEDVEEGDLIDDLLTVGEIVEIIDNLVKEMTEGK